MNVLQEISYSVFHPNALMGREMWKLCTTIFSERPCPFPLLEFSKTLIICHAVTVVKLVGFEPGTHLPNSLSVSARAVTSIA
jgi:hypothetical protein